MSFTDFFHRLLNPHCERCEIHEQERLEREEANKSCKTCEALRLEIEDLKKDKAYIFARMFESSRVEPQSAGIPVQPILGKNVPWSKVRRELEAKDSDLARQNRLAKETEANQNKSMEQLERELLHEEEVNEDNS